MADVSLLVSIAGSGRADAPELVGRILSRGTAVNRDHAGSTALISAARVGSTAVVRELLRHGADASKATRDKGNPPLFWAAAGGHLEVVDLLLVGRVDQGHRCAVHVGLALGILLDVELFFLGPLLAEKVKDDLW